MCYIDQRNIELPPLEIYKLLDDIRNCGIRLEILGGEPLLHGGITDIISYARSHSHIPFITLYTNGIPADEILAAKLKVAGLDAAIVTLISHKSTRHDDFTGVQGSWDKTISGIRHLKEAGIQVYTFTAIHNDNKDDYMNIHDFVHNELGVHALFYQYIPQMKNDPLSVSPAEWSLIKHWVLFEKNISHMKFVRDFYILTGNSCSGGNYVLTVKADGSVQPCPFINNLAIGNIMEKNIWKIYKQRFRNPKFSEFKSVPPQCTDCSYQSVCGGGCKAGNDRLFGTFNHSDHRCMGPFREKISKEALLDKIPTFF
jgi:radical SAM protein with 4Fe4S-binding SPASM domain